jgi:hypothetical protein
MNTQNKKILASILFILISFLCMAQKAPPPPPPTLQTPPPPGLPIDGGILLGACFAVFYGAKKLLNNK